MDKTELFVAATPRLHPEIPVLNPAKEHPTERVIQALQTTPGYGEKVVQENDLFLITGPALVSHHPLPKEHYDRVLWVGKEGEDGAAYDLPWGEDHVVSMAQQEGFWNKVEGWVSEQRQTKPDLRFYLVLGHPMTHPHPLPPEHQEDVYMMGMQSLPSIHGHLTALIDKEEVLEKGNVAAFDPENRAHLFQLATFLTTGAEMMANFGEAFESYNGQLRNSEHHFRLDGKEHTIQRPYLGFRSFSEAFRSAVEIQQAVKNLWLLHAVALRRSGAPMAMIGALELLYKQSYIPNMTLFSLSKHDQQILDAPEEIKAAVMPFSLGIPQSILDGVLLDRKT